MPKIQLPDNYNCIRLSQWTLEQLNDLMYTASETAIYQTVTK